MLISLRSVTNLDLLTFDQKVNNDEFLEACNIYH